MRDTQPPRAFPRTGSARRRAAVTGITGIDRQQTAFAVIVHRRAARPASLPWPDPGAPTDCTTEPPRQQAGAASRREASRSYRAFSGLPLARSLATTISRARATSRAQPSPATRITAAPFTASRARSSSATAAFSKGCSVVVGRIGISAAARAPGSGKSLA